MKTTPHWLHIVLFCCAIFLTSLLVYRLFADKEGVDVANQAPALTTKTSPVENGFLNPAETPLTKQIIELFKDDPIKSLSVLSFGIVQDPADPRVWYISTTQPEKDGFVFGGIYRIDMQKMLWNRVVHPISQKDTAPILLLGISERNLIAKRLSVSVTPSADTCPTVLLTTEEWFQLSLKNVGRGLTPLSSPLPEIEQRWQVWKEFCSP